MLVSRPTLSKYRGDQSADPISWVFWEMSRIFSHTHPAGQGTSEARRGKPADGQQAMGGAASGGRSLPRLVLDGGIMQNHVFAPGDGRGPARGRVLGR